MKSAETKGRDIAGYYEHFLLLARLPASSEEPADYAFLDSYTPKTEMGIAACKIGVVLCMQFDIVPNTNIAAVLNIICQKAILVLLTARLALR
jgi:hypothetical protein